MAMHFLFCYTMHCNKETRCNAKSNANKNKANKKEHNKVKTQEVP